MISNVGQDIGQPFWQLIHRYNQNLSNLRNQINQWPTKGNPPGPQKQQFLDTLIAHFSAADSLFSDHPFAVIARQIASRISPQAGAGALAALLGIQCNVSMDVVRGVFDALLSRDGIAPASPNLVSQAITKLNTEADQDAQKRRADLIRLADENRDFLAQSKEQQTRSAAAFNEQTATASTNLNREVDAAIKSIQKVEAAYKEQMQLQAPVDYWEKKGESHRTALSKSRAWLIGFAFCGSIGLMIALIALFWLAGRLAGSAGKDSTAIYLKFAAIGAIFTTIIFWVARVLLRVYLSDRHLLTDAEERVAMIKTYLALSHEGKVDSTERALVLAPIFRSAADGIVKEEEGPDAFLAGIIARAIDVKGR